MEDHYAALNAQYAAGHLEDQPPDVEEGVRIAPDEDSVSDVAGGIEELNVSNIVDVESTDCTGSAAQSAWL